MKRWHVIIPSIVVYSNRTIAGSEDFTRMTRYNDTSHDKNDKKERWSCYIHRSLDSLDPTARDNLPISTVDEHIQVVDRSSTIVPPFSVPVSHSQT